jgi:hypothetical protein
MPDSLSIEPWVFEVPLPLAVTMSDGRQLEALNAAGRRIMLLMLQQVALDADMPLDAITEDYAEIGVSDVRSAVIAAATKRSQDRCGSHLELLALSYLGVMRDWTHCPNASQGWSFDSP